MEQLAIAELIELLQNESASIDMQFQLWITITSAVAIASFAAGKSLSNWTKCFIAAMYLLATCAIMVRYANDSAQFVFLKAELSGQGVDYPSVGDLRLLRWLIFVMGTLAALTVLFKPPDKAD